jgi:hypothetical protein
VLSKEDYPGSVTLLARLSQEPRRAWYRRGWSCLRSIRSRRRSGEFLVDLANAGRSPHTVRGYRSDLAAFAAAHTGG